MDLALTQWLSGDRMAVGRDRRRAGRCRRRREDRRRTADVAAAPKDGRFDTAKPSFVMRRIDLNAVRSDAMPPGNATEMAAGERATLAAWLAAGAPAR